MHELSIASGLVDKLMQFQEANPDKKIVAVRVGIGELTHVEEEQLRFSYQAITTGTPLEGSAMEVEKIEAQVACPHCSYAGRPKYWDGALSGIAVATLECPSCGKAANAIGGQDCGIKSVRLLEAAAFTS